MATIYRDYSTKQSRMKKVNREEVKAALVAACAVILLVGAWIIRNNLY